MSFNQCFGHCTRLLQTRCLATTCCVLLVPRLLLLHPTAQNAPPCHEWYKYWDALHASGLTATWPIPFNLATHISNGGPMHLAAAKGGPHGPALDKACMHLLHAGVVTVVTSMYVNNKAQPSTAPYLLWLVGCSVCVAHRGVHLQKRPHSTQEAFMPEKQRCHLTLVVRAEWYRCPHGAHHCTFFANTIHTLLQKRMAKEMVSMMYGCARI